MAQQSSATPSASTRAARESVTAIEQRVHRERDSTPMRVREDVLPGRVAAQRPLDDLGEEPTRDADEPRERVQARRRAT